MDFKFVFFLFFFLPEIGMIEMQSMIILLFSFSLTTVKKKRQKQERDDGLEEKRQDGEQTQDATL
jgi:ABC-type protease/lipase transport system fused ATPase/permease subunit